MVTLYQGGTCREKKIRRGKRTETKGKGTAQTDGRKNDYGKDGGGTTKQRRKRVASSIRRGDKENFKTDERV